MGQASVDLPNLDLPILTLNYLKQAVDKLNMLSKSLYKNIKSYSMKNHISTVNIFFLKFIPFKKIIIKIQLSQIL